MGEINHSEKIIKLPLKIDHLPRDVISYGGKGFVDGKRVSGLIPGIRIAGQIYSTSGEWLGKDFAVLEGEYLTQQDVSRVLGQLAAEDIFCD